LDGLERGDVFVNLSKQIRNVVCGRVWFHCAGGQEVSKCFERGLSAQLW
jgi:hypothetical protein